MGQELTARTKYRGLIKKRLIPCKIVGPAILPGTPITFDERNVGEIRSVAGDLAMALLKIASVKDSNAREETFTTLPESLCRSVAATRTPFRPGTVPRELAGRKRGILALSAATTPTQQRPRQVLARHPDGRRSLLAVYRSEPERPHLPLHTHNQQKLVI